MSARRPRLTIGMPVYNGAELLCGSIDSLLGQSFEDFELLISDNHSSDDTETICREYAARDRRVRYTRLDENIGSSRNFNRVFQLSRSEYFKWASHDDLCHPEFARRCVDVLDHRPDVVWCHSRSRHLDALGRPFDDPGTSNISCLPTTDRSGAGRSRCVTRASERPHQRFHGVLVGGPGCLDVYGVIRSSVIRHTQLLLPYFGCEKVFIAELALRGRYAEIPELLFSSIIHEKAAGSLATAAEQQAYVDPSAAGRLQLVRLRLLRGYLSAIRRAPLTPADRAHCLLSIAQYLLRVSKWRDVLHKTLSGTGLGSDNFRRLSAHRRPQVAERTL